MSRSRPLSAVRATPAALGSRVREDFDSWAVAFGGPVPLAVSAGDYSAPPPPAGGRRGSGEDGRGDASVVLDFDEWVAARSVRPETRRDHLETQRERSTRADAVLRAGPPNERGAPSLPPRSPPAEVHSRRLRPRDVDDLLAEEPDTRAAAAIAVDATFHEVLPEWEAGAGPGAARPVLQASVFSAHHRGPPSWLEYDSRPQLLSVGSAVGRGGGGGGGSSGGVGSGGGGPARARPGSAPPGGRGTHQQPAAAAAAEAPSVVAPAAVGHGARACAGAGVRPASALARAPASPPVPAAAPQARPPRSGSTKSRPRSALPRPASALSRSVQPPPSRVSVAGLYTLVSTAARARMCDEAASRALQRELLAAREAARVPLTMEQATMKRQRQQEERLAAAWREFR